MIIPLTGADPLKHVFEQVIEDIKFRHISWGYRPVERQVEITFSLGEVKCRLTVPYYVIEQMETEEDLVQYFTEQITETYVKWRPPRAITKT